MFRSYLENALNVSIYVAVIRSSLFVNLGVMCNTPIFNISLLILLLDNISSTVIISIGCYVVLI